MGEASLVGHGETVVRVRDLHKRYRKTLAVRGVAFDVRRGEMFGLIGPDGAGKSSVLKAIAGVHTYDGGRIDVFGQHVRSERTAERVKGRLGLMPQGLGNNLYAELSVEENIDYFAGLRLVPPRQLASWKTRLLEITRLTPFRRRPMKQLSGGMKQKLGLVCTLIHQPELALLDEPTTGVDPISRRDFWAILAELVHELKMTAIVSTAYMDEAAYLNRLALLMDGRIVSQGSEGEIEALVTGTVFTFRTSRQIESLNRLKPHFEQVSARGNDIRVFVPGTDAAAARQKLNAVTGGISPQSLVASPPDLEDVLASLLLRDRAPDAGEDVCRSLGATTRDDRTRDDETSGSGTSGSGTRDDGKSDDGKSGSGTGPVDDVAIRADSLVREFGAFRAVDGVSFQVSPGDIFGLLGANGAGKTTVIKMLTGLLPPTAGTGTVAGADMRKAGQAIKERIGYMSQSFSLYLDMTVAENLEFYAGVYGLFPGQARERLAWVLRLAGLQGNERRMTGDLPMGWRQRLALACALIHGPRVVFLDEPTSGVDVLGRRQFWEILLRLAREQGVAILVTTHYMSEAEQCDDLALMFAGRIVARGGPPQLRSQVLEEVGRPLALRCDKPLEALRVTRQAGYPRAALFGRIVRVLSRDHEHDRQQITCALQSAGLSLLGSESQPVTMEDVFVHCIQAKKQQLGSP